MLKLFRDIVAKPAFFVSGLLLFASVATAQGQAISCPVEAADTTGWTKHDEDDFFFKLPLRFQEVQVRSVDSQVGKWKSDSVSVYYDFGYYSNQLDPEKQGVFPELSVCQESEARRTPRIIVYRDEDTGKPRIGAHWPRMGLTIFGAVTDNHGFAEMLAVIQSVQFDPEYYE